MSDMFNLNAEHSCSISAILVKVGDIVQAKQPLMIVDAMKMQSSVVSEQSAKVIEILVKVDDYVEKEQVLIRLEKFVLAQSEPSNAALPDDMQNERLLQNMLTRQGKTLDASRQEAISKRHEKGFKSARENLALLCDPKQFHEYGQFAVAAQRQRQDYETLQSSTAADGIITGIAELTFEQAGEPDISAVLIINDYSVLAGTQGFFHHQKLDRILAIAERRALPVIMYTEGGGGRPGDTDITIVNSGLQCRSFSSWAGLAGVVPRIAVNNGYCFAGNAALFGAADITIATRASFIGMAGPAMIEGGGLGRYKPTQIGPIEQQSANGVVDIVVEDEVEAAKVAKQCLSYFQAPAEKWSEPENPAISTVLPQDRRFVYDIRKIIVGIADQGSFLPIRTGYGAAIVTAFIKIEGRPVGLLASDCKVLGGAIDVDAAEKAADFMQLCNDFSIPIVSLCDTPGFMVGPEHENRGAARRLTRMFEQGARLTVPIVAVVLRKCYGLGAQAILGGSTARPDYMLSWPTGEFGAMGLEGAVTLGFKKELAELEDPVARQQLFDTLLRQQYEKGQATEVASVLEIDAVIEPAKTREILSHALNNLLTK